MADKTIYDPIVANCINRIFQSQGLTRNYQVGDKVVGQDMVFLKQNRPSFHDNVVDIEQRPSNATVQSEAHAILGS